MFINTVFYNGMKDSVVAVSPDRQPETDRMLERLLLKMPHTGGGETSSRREFRVTDHDHQARIKVL